MLKHEIAIDGAQGEGGGQILRTALTLSMLTQQPFRIENIRAKRKKAGLLRQHLTCVQAAQQVCNASVLGAALGSTTLHFSPQAMQSGDFNFDIGSAGSCTLVLQTIMLALAHTPQTSVVRLRGGTHNPMAPSASFLQHSYLPLLSKMGVNSTLTVERHGFFPAGGGELTLTIQPMQAWKILHLNQRGARLNTCSAESLIAAVPADIAKRELATIQTQMDWASEQLHIVGLPSQQGPGNVVQLFIRHEANTEVFTQYGEKGKTAEAVAMRACQDALAYLASPAAVGEHLTDQLLLPMALAGAGSFSAQSISEHTRTNALMIEKFLPVRIDITRITHNHHQVNIRCR